MIHKRASGILLHITSLPSPFGIGNLGTDAYKFVDFLNKAKQSFWQILPLTPPNLNNSNSPYDSSSAFAGSQLLISPELLYQQNLLEKSDILDPPAFPKSKTNYKKAAALNNILLEKAVHNFQRRPQPQPYKSFCRKNAHWLDDYALFTAFANHFKTTDWSTWPKKIKNREKTELKNLSPEIKQQAENQKIIQHLFYSQFFALKDYCKQNNVFLIGDIPLYVTYESADLWANPQFFKLDKSKKPTHIAGVPPDYYSETGQLWGNPIYNWPAIKKSNYRWWLSRMSHNFSLYDLTRIDHFRGLVKYWQVPANENTAINGKWLPGPARHFFDALYKSQPNAPIIVEDLGLITPDVIKLISDLNLTNMKVLHFAFSDPDGQNPYLPHNYSPNCLVYTATHDNNTTKGWFANDLPPEHKKNLATYIGHTPTYAKIPQDLIHLAMTSVANLAITPMQDILALPASARMNNPATKHNNWQWRLTPTQLTTAPAEQLAALTQITNRD